MTPTLTFLGHQGWAIDTSEGVVLIDPLEESMGNGPRRLPVWPERRINFDRMGMIASLVISHEHSDHFDIETLYRLPYRGVVYIPDLSSDAMAEALGSMGFTVNRLREFEDVGLHGKLRLTPLPIIDNIFERDVCAILVRCEEWSFLTPVDGLLAQSSIGWLANNCPIRSIDNYTNNATEMLPHLHGGSSWAPFALGRATVALVDYVEQVRPSNVVISGQGWCFSPPHELLNRMFFPVSSEALAGVGRQLYPFISWSVARPGDQFGAGIDRIVAPYVERKQSRDRLFDAGAAWQGQTLPWTGNRQLGSEGMEDLIRFITGEFGEILKMHAAGLLDALEQDDVRDRSVRPVIGLRVLNEDGPQHFVNAGSGFLPDYSTSNLRLTAAVGIEVWASDLLCLAMGEEEAFLVYESSIRRWNNIEDLYELPVVLELFAGLCPHVRTEAYRDAYSRRLKALAKIQS